VNEFQEQVRRINGRGGVENGIREASDVATDSRIPIQPNAGTNHTRSNRNNESDTTSGSGRGRDTRRRLPAGNRTHSKSNRSNVHVRMNAQENTAMTLDLIHINDGWHLEHAGYDEATNSNLYKCRGCGLTYVVMRIA
jgi:hypothetical protein